MARILCVEDEDELRQHIVNELRDAGYEVFEAGSGKEGLQRIPQISPDLVLSDITMPQMDGLTLLETLRERYPDYGDLPFIFLSDLDERNSLLAKRKLGAKDYLTKPIDFQQMLATIEARLGDVE